MPRVRRNVSQVVRFEQGTPLGALARQLGVDPGELARLIANESPLPPFPEVQEAIARAAGRANRYPDDRWNLVRKAVAEHLDVPADHLWFGAGSTELIAAMAAAVGGPGTTAVFAGPSFVMYRIATTLAGSESVSVPVDAGWRLDLDALGSAVRPDTTVVYLCNPNNPTGTHLPEEAVTRFVDRVGDETLVVVDEAYFEYVRAGDYATAIPLALERPNVVVTRTFSKVYGLAGLRIGYGVGRPETISELQKAQIPFTVNSVAQVAATESLRHPARVAERVAQNAAALELMLKELEVRQIPHVPSQANFVWCRPSADSASTAEILRNRGVLVRAFQDGWQRVTVGTPEENERFLEALDAFPVNPSRATRSPD